MKYTIALLAVSAVALVLLVVHGVVQEMKLHQVKTRTASGALSVDSKEQSIMATKNQVAQLRIAMETERTKAKEMAKRHEEVENAKRESEAKLQACKSEKARGEIKEPCSSPALTCPGRHVRHCAHHHHLCKDCDPCFVFLFFSLIRKPLQVRRLKPRTP